ncbi:hypothetical protein NW768_010069 [Fusarium equiseti]|uniref:Uncharacterized protein n=1 Tax=Fusarium equiseti TaxID=61235 RepID=A0ABQ8R1V0_FUSEQ|nr:hypothetical protein NW768_010069 [Fusarium equiseti]
MSQPKAHEPGQAPSMAQLVPDHEAVWNQKVRWIVGQVQHHKSQGQRVLIYVNQAHRGTSIQTALTNAGVTAVEITTRPEASREMAAQMFRSPVAGIEVLIASYSAGSNVVLRGVCKHGLIAQYPEEFEDYVEATNSLNTLYQTTSPSWNVAFVSETMDVISETRLIRSGMDFVLTRTETLQGLTAEQKKIRACYFVAMIMGHSSSGYPRLRVHWSRMETEEIRREGLFYFALGKLLDEQPSVAVHVTSESIARIALSWVPGTELTDQHVMGARPEATDGVVIFNYVVGGYRAGML